MTQRAIHITKTIIYASLLALFFSIAQLASAQINTSNTDTTISSSGSFDQTIDGVDGGDVTIASGSTLTVQDGQTLVRNPGQSIIIDGTIVLVGTGQIQQTYLWCKDADDDGYCEAFTNLLAQDSQPADYIRINLATSLAADCDDGNDSTTDACRATTFTVTNSSTTKTDYDVLLEIDTASLISQGQLQSDCDDLRFYNLDTGNTGQDYWIESGCNSSQTQVWMRVPSLPNGITDFRMDFNDATASAGTESWSGYAIHPSKASCTDSGDFSTAMSGKYPRGASSEGGVGATGGTHTHTISGTTSAAGLAYYPIKFGSNYGSYYTPAPSHTHTYSGTDDGADFQVPNVNTYICSTTTVPSSLDSNGILFFESLPASGWTRETTFDDRFLKVGSSWTTESGSHTHYFTPASVATDAGPSAFSVMTYTTDHERVWGDTGYHTHGWEGPYDSYTPSDPNTEYPPYRTMVFAHPTSSAAIPTNAIMMFSTEPPLGWTRLSALDGRMPFGSATAGTNGGTSTPTAHSHTYSFSTTTTSSTFATDSGGSDDVSSGEHTLSGTSTSTSALPPHYDILFLQKNDQTDITVTGL